MQKYALLHSNTSSPHKSSQAVDTASRRWICSCNFRCSSAKTSGSKSNKPSWKRRDGGRIGGCWLLLVAAAAAASTEPPGVELWRFQAKFFGQLKRVAGCGVLTGVLLKERQKYLGDPGKNIYWTPAPPCVSRFRALDAEWVALLLCQDAAATWDDDGHALLAGFTTPLGVVQTDNWCESKSSICRFQVHYYLFLLVFEAWSGCSVTPFN